MLIVIISFLVILPITLASTGSAKGDANAITPLYKESQMHIVMETGVWPEECEAEIERREDSY